MKLFFQIVCGSSCKSQPLTTVEWYLVFTCLAVVLSQLPNLNSIAGISIIGAITAVGYCTLIWVMSISKSRPPGVSYDPLRPKSELARTLGILNALGIIAFAFRGHNLTLEIQVCICDILLLCSSHFVQHILFICFMFLIAGNNAFHTKTSILCTHVERGEVCIPHHCHVLISHCNWRLLGLWPFGKFSFQKYI